jgi:hypothetical protein
MADLLEPFDTAVIRSVASENDVTVKALETHLADHQRTMRETPGVEDLVYEWRKQYDDPVLARTESIFVVAVPPTVWEEYGDYLDVDTPVLQAVVAAHGEQTLRLPEIGLSGFPELHAPIIVARS